VTTAFKPEEIVDHLSSNSSQCAADAGSPPRSRLRVRPADLSMRLLQGADLSHPRELDALTRRGWERLEARQGKILHGHGIFYDLRCLTRQRDRSAEALSGVL
jgi:hypothetical protein